MIGERAGVSAVTAEAVGWQGDATEAQCFAFLAMRRVAMLPASYPSTTGTEAPIPGGKLALPLPST
jgi:anhydro-N-acetylmuramic acid kinase